MFVRQVSHIKPN